MTKDIRSEIKGKVLTIALNRPSVKNAVSLEMYTEMTRLLKSAEEDKNINAVLLRGNDECFTSGNDLNDFISNIPESLNNPILNFIRAACDFKKVLIAAVAGDAVGIGTTILFHCDFVAASENSKFRMPFVNLGLIPEAGSTLLLPSYMGHRHAFQFLVMGEQFGAETAKKAGLVNEVVNGSVTDAAEKYAEQIASLPASAVQTAKMLMKKEYSEELNKRIDEEGGLFMKHLLSQEAHDAISAFLFKG